MAWPTNPGMGPKPPRLGSGLRFSKLEAQLGANPKIRDPEALAASIGRKKYGAPAMAQMSATGLKRKGGF